MYVRVISDPSLDKQRYNMSVKRARARVEDTLGQIQNLFGALAKPWPKENEHQQDALVMAAIGVVNSRY